MQFKDKVILVVSWAGMLALGYQIWSLTQHIKTIEVERDVPPLMLDELIPDPIEKRPSKNPKKIVTKGKVLTLTDKEKHCLARNIFYEAGVEDEMGKLAVAQVTWNRLKSGRWGKDICAVVHSKSQFSWTLEKRKLYGEPKGKLWEASLKAKQKFLEGARVKGLDKSMFYHTDYIKAPKWSKKMSQVDKIGQHIFYVDSN